MLRTIINPIFLFLIICGFAQATELEQKVLNLPIALLSGQTLTLGQYKGNKPVYLKFWATWCQTCLKQMPHLQHAHEKYGDRVQIIAINLGVNDDLQSVKSTKKKFGLTMPITIDESGELAKAFNFIGTPYHVLLDAQGNVAYAGYEEAKQLDKYIKSLAAGKAVTTEKPKPEAGAVTPVNLDGMAEKPTALFFVATWCDWYLKDSRPDVSQNCVAAQRQMNTLYEQFPQINWVGVASRLWTGAPELAEYKKKFDVRHPLTIDSTNGVTFEYGVKNYPTLILLNKGKEVFRTQHLTLKELSGKLAELAAH